MSFEANLLQRDNGPNHTCVIKKHSELSQVLNLNSNRSVKCRTERCGLHHVHGVLEKIPLPLFKDDPFSMKHAWMNLRDREQFKVLVIRHLLHGNWLVCLVSEVLFSSNGHKDL